MNARLQWWMVRISAGAGIAVGLLVLYLGFCGVRSLLAGGSRAVATTPALAPAAPVPTPTPPATPTPAPAPAPLPAPKPVTGAKPRTPRPKPPVLNPASNVKWPADTVGGPTSWTRSLEERASDWDPESRRSVIYIASKTGKPETFPVVAGLLCDQNKQVTEDAKKTLIKIGKKAGDSAQLAELERKVKEAKAAVIEAQKALDAVAKDDKEELENVLEDIKQDLREAQKARDLVIIGRAATNALGSALEQGQDDLKLESAKCLREIGRPATERLIRAFASDDRVAYVYAQHAVYHIGAPAKELLELAVEDPAQPAQVSILAAQVLQWLKDGKAPSCNPRQDRALAQEKAKIEAELHANAEAERKAKEFAEALTAAQRQAGAAQRGADDAKARVEEVMAIVRTKANTADIQEALQAVKSANIWARHTAVTARDAYGRAYGLITPPDPCASKCRR